MEMILNLRDVEFPMMKLNHDPNGSIQWLDYDVSIQMQCIVDDAFDNFEIHGPYPIQMIQPNVGVHAKNHPINCLYYIVLCPIDHQFQNQILTSVSNCMINDGLTLCARIIKLSGFGSMASVLSSISISSCKILS